MNALSHFDFWLDRVPEILELSLYEDYLEALCTRLNNCEESNKNYVFLDDFMPAFSIEPFEPYLEAHQFFAFS